jgi:hypothetical protein
MDTRFKKMHHQEHGAAAFMKKPGEAGSILSHLILQLKIYLRPAIGTIILLNVLAIPLKRG